MVKVGDFTLELVQADTKEAFKEHTGPAPNNHVYAEVEPDVEYFIRAGSSVGGVQVELTVDGVHLGYRQYFSIPNSEYGGSWERKNGMQKMTALCFNIAHVKREGGMPSMLTGKVEAVFYKLGALEYKPANDFASKELTGESKLGGKKCVVSKNGKYVLDDKKFDSKIAKNALIPNYGRGERICTVTLNYCTAVGLIVNKILDAPPSEPDNDENVEVKLEKRKKRRIRTQNAKKCNTACAPQLSSPVEKKIKASAPTSCVEGSNNRTEIDLTGNDDCVEIDLTGDDERLI